MDINVSNRNFQRFQLVVFETETIELDLFNSIEEKAKILPINKTAYDPNFWKGYSIIEPNTAIKEFRTEK